ncbi:hypothetical protein GP486_002780 [Trichoglossum hirsutum]|uniref:NadR/Ttd14 AAA domain-containing protein n=1 Tax=Trichoglossum hirsutum TaxID=265104 RepID=A0A9P8LEA7_9PEZI|nr:hypothetical protein GP486_002780 [Trichoglossum hirsutum]
MAHNTGPKNIFVVGAQCTGKTTLVKALQEHFSQPHDRSSTLSFSQPPVTIHEVARKVLKKYKFTREDITTSPIRALQLQERILEAQFEAENAVSRGDWYISDRSGIDPIVYASVFVGEEAAEKLFASAAWGKLEEKMKAGLVVLCEVGWDWLVDDGVRLIPKDLGDWAKVDAAFRNLLKARGINYTVISQDNPDIYERVAIVTDAHKYQH